jgi:ABC-type Fe3+/spermidine/putrescine transport system ATPase subunit
MVRPEAVRIVEADALACTVRSTAYLGSVTDFVFESEAGSILATVHGEGLVELESGDSAHITFETAGVHLLRPDSHEETS